MDTDLDHSRATPKPIQIKPTSTGLAVDYDGVPMVLDLGAAIPLGGHWRWSFDGSLALSAREEAAGQEPFGGDTRAGAGMLRYQSVTMAYSDQGGPILSLAVKTFQEESPEKSAEGSFVVVEATALRELIRTSVADSFFQTTFNAPIVRLAEGLNFLAYTWGLIGEEGTGMGGHFPDAALAPNLAALPEQLRLADFSPDRDIHLTPEKPFAPLICYDGQEHTVVISPLDHYMISPLRLIGSPDGTAVARGLHGSIETIPAGTHTRTILVFGTGTVATVLKWGRLLSRAAGKEGKKTPESLVANTLGFWNCYGGYYAQLFRPTSAETLTGLAQYFQDEDLPVRYWGLDLWYHYEKVGFARSYQPDENKYPQGLEAVYRDTKVPYLLHMSAFDPANNYNATHQMEDGEGSSYPTSPELYRELAQRFKSWGATGIWHDFMRTLQQNCAPLRGNLGAADRWFDDLSTSMALEGLDVMLCMPTMGHYLASAAYDNVVAVRTSTDYVNHQPGQLELLGHINEYRRMFSPQRNLRQNLMLSLIAGALGLAPSFDVFITNPNHPGGFANASATQDALARALSAGIVGIGDKLGEVNRELLTHLAFPDGTLAQPDHPLYPVVGTLQSNPSLFYTETTVGGYRWVYLLVVNLSDEQHEYHYELESSLGSGDWLVYDYFDDDWLTGTEVSGRMEPGGVRYLIGVPKISGLHPLGFTDKYVTIPKRQVKGIDHGPYRLDFDLVLPIGRTYSFAVAGPESVTASGIGLVVQSVQRRGSLTQVEFLAETDPCRLTLRSG